MPELLVGTAAAGATAGATSTGLSTALTILGGLATVTSIIGGMSAAESEATALTQQAAFTDVEAGQGQLESMQRQTQMKRELLRVLGENDVTIAAAGIDVASGGIAQDSRQAANERAARELTIEREDDELRRALVKARARGLRTRAGDVRTGGLLRAVGKGLEFGIDVAERG